MPETCPLNIGEHRYPIPETCERQCSEIYSDFRQTENRHEDIYGDNPGNCDTHESADLETSSEDMFAISATEREYIVIDECADCSNEYRETGAAFICPYAAEEEVSPHDFGQLQLFQREN